MHPYSNNSQSKAKNNNQQQELGNTEQKDMLSLAGIPSQISNRIGQVLSWTSSALTGNSPQAASKLNETSLLSYSNQGGVPHQEEHELARGIKRKMSISTPPMGLKSNTTKAKHPFYEESIELLPSKRVALIFYTAV